MTDPRTESIAFRVALLKSEYLRIRIVLGTILAAFLVRTIRVIILGGGRENLVSWLMTLGLLGFFVAYEFVMLRAVNHAQFRKFDNCGVDLAQQHPLGISAGHCRRVSIRCLHSSDLSTFGKPRAALPSLFLSAFPRSG
jgi:hypothetical protein